MRSTICGSGCTRFNSGLPQHNPEPSTPRGMRRHAKRNDGQKKHAEAAWNRVRSVRQTKYQKLLNTTGLTRGI